MKNELLLATVLLVAAGCATQGDYDMRSDSRANADYLVTKTANAPLDPNRKVNEQECTRSVDVAAGNLRCK